jgi:purine-binding chemotaxis protein CheW
MDRSSVIVVLSLDEQRYALWLPAVERVIRAVFVTPLPSAPEIVLGVNDVRGEVVPVMDVRRRFRLPPRELQLSDQLILARTARRRVALLVDGVAGVELAEPEAYTSGDALPPESSYVAGLLRRRDGMVLIHDLDAFLSLDEEVRLSHALTARGGNA